MEAIPRIHSRTGLIETARALVSESAICRALQEGSVENVGGFHHLPPSGLPGWILRVRSKHGRTWFLAVMMDDIKHRYVCKRLTKIPWLEWAGNGSPFRTLQTGDRPRHNFFMQQEARRLGKG